MMEAGISEEDAVSTQIENKPIDWKSYEDRKYEKNENLFIKDDGEEIHSFHPEYKDKK